MILYLYLTLAVVSCIFVGGNSLYNGNEDYLYHGLMASFLVPIMMPLYFLLGDYMLWP